jgi:phage repressor protein C with HTH and peptisase S24 domain
MLTGEELGRAIEAARLKKGVSKVELANQFRVKPPSVTGWVKTGRIGKDTLYRLMDYFSDVVGPDHWGLRQAEVLSFPSAKDLPAKESMVVIKRYAQNGGMGNGQIAEQFPDVVDTMRVSQEWLSRNVIYSSLDNLALITGLGDSMEGTFSDGDVLLVDRGVTEVKLDAVYVLSLHDELYIKRLQRRPDGALLMISDNDKYPPYVIENGDRDAFKVEGRVLLAWNARKL